MPWIENVSLAAIKEALHYDPGPNSMLIQIVDQDMDHPKAKYPFKETRKFKFLDVEEPECLDGITEEDAKYIVQALRHAKEKNMNVVVHCVAGVCRSGAVVEAALFIGFQDTEVFRIPNIRVKQAILAAFNKEN